jgi:HEPN domain-containing protein
MLECGTDSCPCVIRKCARFAKCEECIEHHKTHKKYPEAYCKRPRKEKKSKATVVPSKDQK